MFFYNQQTLFESRMFFGRMYWKNLRASSVLLVILFSHAHCTKRHISCTVHNGGSEKVPLSLLHVKAVGSEDIVHYVWSTYKIPSVLVARTDNDTILKLDFKKMSSFEKGGIGFSKKPLNVIGIVISELWQKSYSKDTDSIADVNSEKGLGLESFQWSQLTNTSLSCSHFFALVKFSSSSKEEECFSKNGTFGIKFSTAGDEEYDKTPPHLIYTGNSTQIKIEFDDLYANSSRIRYGMEMNIFTTFSKGCISHNCEAISSTSISDEFSPGVFSDVDFLPQCGEKGTFVSWRPVAYTSKEPSVANSSDAQISKTCSPYAISNVRSVAELYFSEQVDASGNIFNITFGTQGDGFYPKTEFTTWTLMIGTGVAVHSKLSAAVIIFSSIGLGALLLFILAGSIFLTVKHCRRQDDDLLLSEHKF